MNEIGGTKALGPIFGGIFGVIVSPRTYLRILHTWLAFPLGLAYFVVFVTLFALGMGLLIVWVGLLVLAFAGVLAWAAILFERPVAAVENCYAHDEAGGGTKDRVMRSGAYGLVVNAQLGYVSLLRRHTTTPTEPDEAEAAEPVQGGPELLVSYSSPNAPKPAVAPRQAQSQGSWFEPTAITTLKQSGRLSL